VTNIAPELPPPGIGHVAEGGEIGPIQSGWRLAAREFAQNRLAVLGLGALIFFVIFCYLGPLVYHGGLTSNLTATNIPPSAGYPLGTDNQGFDVLEELMIGGRAALEIGFFSRATPWASISTARNPSAVAARLKVRSDVS